MDKDKWAETAAEAEMRLRKMAGEASTAVTSSEQYSKWKSLTSDQRFWIAGATLIAFLLLVCWLIWPTSASAQECKPEYPPGLKLVCVGGQIAIDSDAVDHMVVTPHKCGRQA